jgi:hypothetical protein
MSWCKEEENESRVVGRGNLEFLSMCGSLPLLAVLGPVNV